MIRTRGNEVDGRDAQIVVRDLHKQYRVAERRAGLLASVGSLFWRKYKTVNAVDGIDFSLRPGEVVGFLGPNGAGKTTTLKVLSGLLHPTSGEVSVLGHQPWRRERAFLKSIALVMGQRSQLQWDIPAIDSFTLNRTIYEVPDGEFRETLDELVELLELKDLLNKPVRQLSLGERMKCELAASLLHRPAILFLDEPTLGVDVTMQGRIRQFVGGYNERTGATVLLTSHYMIVIHHGRLLYDGRLGELTEQLAPFKTIRLDLDPATPISGPVPWNRYGAVLEAGNGKVSIRVPKADAAGTVARLLSDLPIKDLTVEDPPIEEVIDIVFRSERPADEPE
jgi:ABC-2 type transport system ATP-binding protein